LVAADGLRFPVDIFTFPETLRIFFLCKGMMTSHEEFQSLKKGKTIKEIASWRL